jgi:isopenicillin N synthase-like dioxygenase
MQATTEYKVTDTSSIQSATTINVGKEQDRTIPCFDIRGLDGLSAPARKTLIEEFGNALRDVGFVAIYAPELEEFSKEAYALQEQYFAQRHNEKMKDWHDNNGQTGFSYKGLETAAGATVADLKETFFVTADMKAWPKNPTNFEEVMRKDLKIMSDLAAQVMRILLSYVGEEEAANSSLATEGDRRIRLACYPAPTAADNVNAKAAEAHFDLNAVTILPRATRPGLQLLTKGNQWLPVMVPEGYAIVNLGDQWVKKSAGILKGTLHQVVYDATNTTPRQARILFAAFPDNYSLKPFDSCAKKATAGMTPSESGDHLRQFGDVTVQENLFGRLIEMGSFGEVSREMIIDLRNKGLIQAPCQKIKDQFPDIFS